MICVHDLGRPEAGDDCGGSGLSSRRGSSLDPLRQKIVLDRQPPDLGVKLLHLCLGRAFRPAATRKHIGHALNRLTLPRADLVRVNLVPRGDLLDRLVATQRLKRDLGLKLVCKLPAFRHFVSLRKVRDTP